MASGVRRRPSVLRHSYRTGRRPRHCSVVSEDCPRDQGVQPTDVCALGELNLDVSGAGPQLHLGIEVQFAGVLLVRRCVELLFLPSVYAPCPTCKGARYNAKTLEIKIRDRSIAEVLAMTVDGAFEFFADDDPLRRSLGVLRQVGLGYIRLGQSATELSGGEAQRVKLATELQRAQRGETLYVLDEPTTGLHPSDVAKLMKQLEGLVEAGNTVIVVEHDMAVAAASDWIIDIGPGAGDEG